jgi:hypothetical protein
VEGTAVAKPYTQTPTAAAGAVRDSVREASGGCEEHSAANTHSTESRSSSGEWASATRGSAQCDTSRDHEGTVAAVNAAYCAANLISFRDAAHPNITLNARCSLSMLPSRCVRQEICALIEHLIALIRVSIRDRNIRSKL